MKLLWLDDIRDPKRGDWLFSYAPEFAYGDGEVIWVKNYDDFVNWVEKNGLPDMICFDHDLADNNSNEKTGYDAAKWLVDYCMTNNLSIPNFNIQSANPVGKDNIKYLLINYQKHYEQKNKTSQ